MLGGFAATFWKFCYDHDSAIARCSGPTVHCCGRTAQRVCSGMLLVCDGSECGGDTHAPYWRAL
jgi:hypothetical protein